MLVGALIGLGIYAAEGLTQEQTVSPDGRYYRHVNRPQPYRRRWLLPALLGAGLAPWLVTNAAALVVLGMVAELLTGRWEAAFLLCSLPGVGWICARFPILVDAPSMAFGLAAVALWPVHPALGILCALLSGACKESGPIFAAAWGWNPWLLAGLLAVRWWGRGYATGDRWLRPAAEIFERERVTHGRPWWRDTLGWGALLPLAWIGGISKEAALAAAIAFGSTLIASDRARLWAWAAPALVVCAMHAPSWAIGLGCGMQFYMLRREI